MKQIVLIVVVCALVAYIIMSAIASREKKKRDCDNAYFDEDPCVEDHVYHADDVAIDTHHDTDEHTQTTHDKSKKTKKAVTGTIAFGTDTGTIATADNDAAHTKGPDSHSFSLADVWDTPMHEDDEKEQQEVQRMIETTLRSGAIAEDNIVKPSKRVMKAFKAPSVLKIKNSAMLARSLQPEVSCNRTDGYVNQDETMLYRNRAPITKMAQTGERPTWGMTDAWLDNRNQIEELD